MKLVIDASAAVGMAVDSPAANRIRQYISGAEAVLVPDLYPYEIGNAFWKYLRFKGMDPAVCTRGICYCLQLPDEFLPGVSLAEDAFTLAAEAGLTVYDATYLVCARHYDATLLTRDKKLAAVGKKQKIDVLNPV